MRGLAQDCFHRFEDWFRLQYHSFAATERTVIHGFVPILSELPEIVHVDINQAGFSRAANNSVMKRTGEKLREDGDDIEFHMLGNYLGSAGTRLHRLNPICSSGIQFAQAFRQPDLDSSSCGVDTGANFGSKRDEQFARENANYEDPGFRQRVAFLFAGSLHILD